jgi:hypothetical protein
MLKNYVIASDTQRAQARGNPERMGPATSADYVNCPTFSLIDNH